MIRTRALPLVGVTLAAAFACRGKSATTTDPTPTGPATVEVALADVGLEASSLDRTADPCSDFFQYTCGGWLAANPIPADRARWGRFGELSDRNELALRTIIEAAAASPKDDVEKTFGDYYASCLDLAAIEQRGLDGVKPLLDFVAKAKDPKFLSAAITALHKHRVFALWGLEAEADFADSRTAILFVDTAGLGLPDRDYYLSDDYAAPRAAYRKHLAALLELAGSAKGKAAAALADDVLAFETALAGVTKTAVERRDVPKMYNPGDLTTLAMAMPAFDWQTYFAAVGNPTPGKLSITTPAYFDALPGIHESDACRGAGEDDVPGQQRERLGREGDQARDVVDHVGRRTVLDDRPVEHRHDPLGTRVEVGLDPRPERAEGVEALGPGPLAVAALKVARRDVVGDGVAEDEVERVAGIDVPAQPADDHGELTLVADLAGLRGHDDGVTGADDGRVGHEEHQRGRRRLAAHLASVLGVVLPDADDLAARDDRREQADVRDLVDRPGQLDALVEGVAGDLCDLLPCPVDEPVGRVLARGEPRDAHGCSLRPRRRNLGRMPGRATRCGAHPLGRPRPPRRRRRSPRRRHRASTPRSRPRAGRAPSGAAGGPRR